MTRLIVTIDYDGDLPDPSEDDGMWKLYSFCTRHSSFKEPEELGLGRGLDPKTNCPKVNNPGLRQKLKVGLAFWLSYFEHGASMFFRKGTQSPPDMQWDGNKNAGLLVWEHEPSDMGAKTYEDRAKDADAFLRIHNDWANGRGYYFSIEDEQGENIDSCGGYYDSDSDYMLDEIAHELIGHEFEVKGDAGEHFEHKLRKKVKESESKKQEPVAGAT